MSNENQPRPEPPASPPRIVSLLPSITEILCELGLSHRIVGLTHECDHPRELIASKRAVVVTTSEINPTTMTQDEIHTAVCGSLTNGHSLYGLKKDVLLEMKPDVIFTQSLCDVCAVSYPVVVDTCAKIFGGGVSGDCDTANATTTTTTLNPTIISLEPENLADCLRTFHVAAKALSSYYPHLIEKAVDITTSIERGLDAIREAVEATRASKRKPTVAFLEWHSPIFCGGHWIPDMIEIAGGDYVMPAKSGDYSAAMTDDDFRKLDPDFILIGPCGFSLDRTVRDTLHICGNKPWWRDMRAVKEGNVFALDGNSYYARPGPRLLQGTAIIAACIHGIDVARNLKDEDQNLQLIPPDAYCQIKPAMYDYDADTRDTHSLLHYVTDVLSATPLIPACTLRPHPTCPLFISWNGVIALAYDGFPPSLAMAKKRIDAFVPNLEEEQNGSKWPKTTLAAVNDDCVIDLTLDDLKLLQAICAEHSDGIASETENVEIDVSTLTSVLYESRGLERCTTKHDVTLSKHEQRSGFDSMNSSTTSEEEKARVDTVINERTDLEAYLPRVNAPGSRIGSYRNKARAGATCVAFLHPLPIALSERLRDFQRAVDAEFPGRYSWLEEISWHCTLRSLDLK